MLEELHKRMPILRERIFRPFVFKTNPSYVSVIALIFAAGAGYLFYSQKFLLAGIFVLLNGFFDVLDGEIAKKFGFTSMFGDFLDHTFDRVADVLMFAGVALLPQIPVWLGWPATILVLLVSYLGTQAQALTGKRLYAGWLSRSDRIAVLAAAGAIAGFYGIIVIYYALILVLVLSTLSFLQRFFTIWKDIKNLPVK
ncbi:MAG: CDP-alcohol phosphatidyltransferase family protein [DPANN group archaeon]|nr:CDP-alcohol phosphatidyltransferase family protein [DPANN group archaeon]